MCKENKAFKETIEWIKNNPYTEEIISISDVELLNGNGKRIIVSEIQGDYPVDVKFTAQQKIEVVYKNTYFGLRKDIIVAGFDAVRYKKCTNNMYTGEYLDEDGTISVSFVGEYSKIIETVDC